MMWLDKSLADSLVNGILHHYQSIYDGTHRNSGIIDDIVVDGKKYLIRYNRNTGVHYDFNVYDGDEKIAQGDFPAVEVNAQYRAIRFYSESLAPIFEYKI